MTSNNMLMGYSQSRWLMARCMLEIIIYEHLPTEPFGK